VLLSVDGDEYLAAEKLFKQLLGVTADDLVSDSEDTDVWVEEQTPLKEIYGSRFTVLNATACTVQLPPASTGVLPKKISIEFRKSMRYPRHLPPHLVIHSEPKLPSHVCLSLIRQAGLFAWETLRGIGMVWGLSDWIEENIERIVKHPGRLSDLDGVVSGEATHIPLMLAKPESNGVSRVKDIDWTPRGGSLEIPVSASRKTLPAWKHRDEVISIATRNRVIVVTGETGSGKSTQIPQFLLDDFLFRGLSHAVDIICTQPRRISALGLADRVSDERNEKVGMSVGYSIRGESKSGKDTKLRFVTTGVLLRRFLSDPNLNGVSHVIVDEVHERTVDGDFLLLLLKELLVKRKDLTIILMSATVEADEYASYFSQHSVGRVHIEGRTFPVRDLYLESVLSLTEYRPPLRKVKKDHTFEPDIFGEGIADALKVLSTGILDYELIARTVELVCQKNRDKGGILIFLPGKSLAASVVTFRNR
jgi:ATP-dependent RNA helicase DHX57